jgi:Ca2+-binding EF-hand superfamily protein
MRTYPTPSPLARAALPAFLAAACLAGTAAAQVAVAPPAAYAPPAKPMAPAGGPVIPAPSEPGAQDVVFFGDMQPVLFRLHVRVNGKSFSANWDEFLNKLFAYYDLDGDGVLTKKETQRIIRAESLMSLLSGGFNYFGGNQQNEFARPEEVDANKDGKITKDELFAYYRKLGAGGLRGQGANQNGLSGRLTTSLFRHLDLNGDGKLSRDELMQAPQSLHKLDADDDEMITSDELLPQTGMMYELVGGQRPELPATSAILVLVPGSPVAPVTQRLLAHYDKDHNGKLSRKEIGLDKEAFDKLDANHDGQLDAAELAKWLSRPADLELVVQLGQTGKERGKPSIFDPLIELSNMLAKKAPVDVFSPSGRKMPLAAAVRKEGEGVVVKLGDAEISLQRGNGNNNVYFGPGNGVKGYYLQQFKAGAGAKGYIDKKDLMNGGEVQFLSGIFPLADRDNDGKLYEKELSAFLDLEALGASSHLYLRVTDQGRGLYELIDADGDGRLSVRELRTAWERLKPYDRDGKGLIAESDIPRQFQLALEQGQLSYPFQFATVVQAGRRSGKQVTPRGPSWFRKMDRNNDGDLSLREWLGTEEEFRRMDADGDGLISGEEAERADAALKKGQKATAPAAPAKQRPAPKATAARP